MRKNIKNYTSGVQVENTIIEINKLLVKNGATKIMIDYENKEPTGLMFMLNTGEKLLPIKLPARTKGVERVFFKNKKPGRYSMTPDPLTEREIEQAKRTAWRNIKDWIDAQLALIEAEMVKFEEVFLPYVVMGNETVYEKFQSGTLSIGSGGTS